MNVSTRLGCTNLVASLQPFVVLHAVQYVTEYYLLPVLLQRNLGAPITVSVLSTSSISLPLAVLYLLIRTKAVPRFVGRNPISASLGGIFLLWIIGFIALVWFFDKANSDARALLDLHGVPFYLTVFVVVVWLPFLEEILFRGYFFELLNDHIGIMASTILSAGLFAVSHGIWEGFGPQSVLYFVDSLIFTFVHAQGGVLAAGVAHSFVNAYVLVLNI